MPAPPPFYVHPPRRCASGERRAGLRVAGFAAVLTALAGCGSSDVKFAPACPALSLLADGGDVTRFAPGGQDVTNMILRARIKSVPAKCATADAGHVRATLSVSAEVQRGPAAAGNTLAAPYFVAVTEGDRVLQEQDFNLTATFPTNVAQVSVTGDDIELMLPVSKSKSAAAYQIYVGFRLTPEQLAYNRSRRIP